MHRAAIRECPGRFLDVAVSAVAAGLPLLAAAGCIGSATTAGSTCAAGPTTSAPGSADADAVECRRAAALLEEGLRHIPAGETRTEHVRGAFCYRSGDIFSAGHDVAFAVLSRRVGGDDGYDERRGCAFYSRRSGAWRVRSVHPGWGHPIGMGFELQDLSGDNVPEVLYTRNQGVNTASYKVFRYDAGADDVYVACEEIADPSWADGWVRSFHNCGRAGLENSVGRWDWVGRRLVPRWYSDQDFCPWEHVIPTGDEAVTISHYVEAEGDNPRLSFATRGNVCCFRNGCCGQSRPLLAAIWKAGEAERYVEIVPKMELPKELGAEYDFEDAVSRLVHQEEIKLSPEAVVKLEDGRSFRLGDLASVTVTEEIPPFFIARTENALERLEEVTEGGPVLSVGMGDPCSAEAWLDSLRRRDNRLSKGARGRPYLFVAGSEVPVLSPVLIRVTRAALEGSRVNLEVEVRLYPVETKEEPRAKRPLACLALDRLPPGTYSLSATLREVRYVRADRCSFERAGVIRSHELSMEFELAP